MKYKKTRAVLVIISDDDETSSINKFVFLLYRFILLRRFFSLSGTVFLLRCITMLITSLSVPGAHLQCKPRNSPLHGSNSFDNLAVKLSQAYIIWRGAGMSIQGVRTCGDYMFSGHTVALTTLNFFITECMLCSNTHVYQFSFSIMFQILRDTYIICTLSRG